MNEFELDLRQILMIFKKRLIMIVAFTVLCGASAYIITSLVIKPTYTATATMYVYSNSNRSSQEITSSEITASQALLNTYLVVLKSDTVLDEVAKTLNLDYSGNTIRGMMTASAIDSTEAFAVKITNRNPELAQLIVNTIIKVAPPQIVRVVKAGGVEVIDYAKLPIIPSAPNKAMISMIVALIGFLCGLGFVLLLIKLDTKVHDTDDLARAFEIPVLGAIPTMTNMDFSSARKWV